MVFQSIKTKATVISKINATDIEKYFSLQNNRNIIKDTQTGEKIYQLNDPQYESTMYFQAKISFGFQVF